MLIVVEGIVMCFVLLIVCVVGISNGPVGLVLLYEKDVQERVVELGLTTKDRIKKNFIICSIAMFVPLFVLPPLMVYGINGVTDFGMLFGKCQSFFGFRVCLTVSLLIGTGSVRQRLGKFPVLMI